MLDIDFSDRLKKLPPYLFVEIDKMKRKAISEGKDIIDFGIGDPDLPAPDFVLEALYKASKDPSNHHYALDAGLPKLRQAIAKWYFDRFNVKLDFNTEIYPLIGSKEGIAHLPLGVVNPGDIVLIPDPCYPAYISGTTFADGKIKVIPLKAENDFLPDLKKINRAKLMFINYPNNPTSACADRNFFSKIVEIAKEKQIIVVSDLAYSEIYFGNLKPPSILEIEGAKDIAVEFHSLSKTFNMTGWRIGWVSGNSKIISALAKVKTNVDSGIFQPIQIAGIKALESDGSFPEKMRSIYQERRDILVDGLNSLGWKVQKPKAAFYVWAGLPKPHTSSVEFCKLLFEKANIVVTPGVGFGQNGEGFIRFALTINKERIKEAVERIRKL